MHEGMLYEYPREQILEELIQIFTIEIVIYQLLDFDFPF